MPLVTALFSDIRSPGFLTVCVFAGLLIAIAVRRKLCEPEEEVPKSSLQRKNSPIPEEGEEGEEQEGQEQEEVDQIVNEAAKKTN